MQWYYRMWTKHLLGNYFIIIFIELQLIFFGGVKINYSPCKIILWELVILWVLVVPIQAI